MTGGCPWALRSKRAHVDFGDGVVEHIFAFAEQVTEQLSEERGV